MSYWMSRYWLDEYYESDQDEKKPKRPLKKYYKPQRKLTLKEEYDPPDELMKPIDVKMLPVSKRFMPDRSSVKETVYSHCHDTSDSSDFSDAEPSSELFLRRRDHDGRKRRMRERQRTLLQQVTPERRAELRRKFSETRKKFKALRVGRHKKLIG